MNAPARPEPKSIDMMTYVRTFLRRKWVVLGVAALVVVLSALYTLRQPKVYSAQVSVIIDTSAPRVLDKEVQDVLDSGATNYWASREYHETQNKIILSRAVSSRVVAKLGLQSDASFLRLESIKDPALRAEAMSEIDVPALLMSKIKVAPIKESRIVQIIVEDFEPSRAALLANEVAEAYIAENLALKLKMTESASRWLEDQMVSLKAESGESELAVYEFKKQADMLTASLEDRASMVTQKLTNLNSALTEVRTRIAALKARVDAMSELRRNAQDDGQASWADTLATYSKSSVVIDLKTRYVTIAVECSELTGKYLDGHPALVNCRAKRQAAKDELVEEMSAMIKGAQTELREAQLNERNLVALFDAAKDEAFVLNKKQIDFDRLKRDSDNNQRLYDMVRKRIKDIELSGALRTSNVRVLDAARPMTVPIRPSVKGNVLFALILGLLGGLGVALLLEMLDNTIASQSDLETALGLPFLGLVPSMPEEKLALAGASRDLLMHRQPKSAVAECCRAIRTNLLFMSPDRPFRSMVVTSSGPLEGKSTSVINLGIAMAQSGNRVILLDTDMRRPRLHRALGVPNDVGVSSLIVGEGKLEHAVKTTEVPNLFLLPCGPIPPNPAELLHTQAFKDLIAQLLQRYDKVILDSPPVGAVADAAVLSTRVDGVVVVVKAGVTSREMAKRTVRALADVNANIYGAILNDINLDDPKYGYDHKAYSGYGYYYREPKDEAAS